MPARRRSLSLSIPAPRDMDATPFATILSELLKRMPGALGAAVCDHDGETVDYAGAIDPFDLKVATAHWRIVIGQILASPVFSGLKWLVVRGAKRSYLIHTLPDRYALCVILRRRAGFSPFARPVGVCLRALAREAAWPPPVEAPPIWFAVSVKTTRNHRPARVFSSEGVAFDLEVLGKVVGLRKQERGYRVRLDSGKELTLVREPGGAWYADDEPL